MRVSSAVQLLPLLMLAALPFASAQTLVQEGPDPAVLRVGGRAILRLVAEVPPEEFRLGLLPAIPGLELTAGRPRAIVWPGDPPELRRSCIEILLVPRSAGVFTVPAFAADAGGASLSSRPFSLDARRDEVGGEQAFLEVLASPAETYVGGRLRFVLRVGFDAAFFARDLVPLFRRELDLQLQVQARWLSSSQVEGLMPQGEIVAAAGGDEERSRSLALDDFVVRAPFGEPRERAGRRFEVLEIRRDFIAAAAGSLDIPDSVLRFAFATRFAEDFVNGRVPLDRQDAYVFGPGPRILVRPLPAAGRPADFSGLVGQLRLEASVESRELQAGASFAVSLLVEGEGDLSALEAPRPALPAGLRLLGVVREKPTSPSRQVFVYEFLPESTGPRELPSFTLTTFDPAICKYREEKSPALPLRIAPGAGAAVSRGRTSAPAARRPGVDDIHAPKPMADPGRDARRRLGGALASSLLLAPWLIAAGAWFLRRAREREKADPQAARSRAALGVFRAATGAPGADFLAAFAEYLGRKLGETEAAVIGPDLLEKLLATGIPAPLAEEAAGFVQSQVESSYGGKADPADPAHVQSLVQALEEAFGRQERRP